MSDDDDIRSALSRAHEPAAPFDAIRERRPRRFRAVRAFALASVAIGMLVFAIAWPTASPESEPDSVIDLTSPTLSSTTLTMPLDSLLVVPGLAALETTPTLTTGGLP